MNDEIADFVFSAICGLLLAVAIAVEMGWLP
jgi:hypothetical protein